MTSSSGRIKGINYPVICVALAALATSMLFCFVVYPMMSDPLNLLLDPDRHGRLAYGILKYHTFSYYPDSDPTVGRGPLYPLFIAGLLVVTNDWWPHAVQVGQCILFALLCAMVYWMSSILWSRRVAAFLAGICVLHPLLIWYTSRIWVETLATFLFTLIMASVLYFSLRPSIARGVAVGAVIGLSALCKSTFLPYALFVPGLLLWMLRGKTCLRTALPILVTALLIVAPWTVRNWRLTGHFIPVHGRIGFNLQVGDDIVDHLTQSRFSLAYLWDRSLADMAEVQKAIPSDLPKHEREMVLDKILVERTTSRYKAHPQFLAKKILINAGLFWSLGETTKKSLALGLLLVPLFALFVGSIVVLGRRGQLMGVRGIHIILIMLYYLMHLPMEAVARYSVVLIPGMIIYSLGTVTDFALKDRKRAL